MICSSSTICTPDPRRKRVPLPVLCGLCLFAALPVQAAGTGAEVLIARAREDVIRDDGLTAEMTLRRAMRAGASRQDVAALMGATFVARRQPERARRWLGGAEFSSRDAALGFRTLGRLEQEEGRLNEAGAAYDRALELAPNDPVLWVDIGRLRVAGGEDMLALEAADRALQFGPGNARALAFKGERVRDQLGLVASLPWFEQAQARDPGDLAVIGEYAAILGELGRAREMLALTRTMLMQDPDNARAFYLQAVLAARAGKFSLARALIKRTGDELKNLPAAMLLDGVLELQAGTHNLAVDTLGLLVRKQPANVRAQLLYARALAGTGEDRTLVKRFARVAARLDAPAYLLTLVARGYENLGERELAAPLLDRAAMIEAATFAPLAGMSELGSLLVAGRPAEAAALAESRRNAAPGSRRAQEWAGDVQFALGQPARAYARYSLAAHTRLDEHLFARMVAALLQAGRRGEAGRFAEAFLARNPTSKLAARLAADRAAGAGEWRRAMLLLEHLARNGADGDARVMAELSLARLRAGDARGAEEAGKRAWLLQPASPVTSRAWAMGLAGADQHPAAAAALFDKVRAISGDNALLAEARIMLATRRED